MAPEMEATDPMWCDACLAEISVYDARHVSEVRQEIMNGSTETYRLEFWFCDDKCLMVYFRDEEGP